MRQRSALPGMAIEAGQLSVEILPIYKMHPLGPIFSRRPFLAGDCCSPASKDSED